MVKLQGNHELKRTLIYSFHTNKEENIDYKTPYKFKRSPERRKSKETNKKDRQKTLNIMEEISQI